MLSGELVIGRTARASVRMDCEGFVQGKGDLPMLRPNFYPRFMKQALSTIDCQASSFFSDVSLDWRGDHSPPNGKRQTKAIKKLDIVLVSYLQHRKEKVIMIFLASSPYNYFCPPG